MEHKTDVTDLIPKGLWVYWCVLLVDAALIALAEFAWLNKTLLCEKLGLESIPSLEVASRSGFLGWLVSLQFLLIAFVSLINYRLGRRFDAPKPQVTSWFWMAVAALFLSMDAQVPIRDTLCTFLGVASGTPIYGDGSIWGVMVYSFVFGVIGTRILQELSAYPPALLVFLLATGLAAMGTLLEILSPLKFVAASLEPEHVIALFTGLKSMAVLFCLLAFTLFARRQVFRDPEVALDWFARVWNQMPIKQTTQPHPEEVKPTTAQAIQMTQPAPPPAREPISKPVPVTPTLTKDVEATATPATTTPKIPAAPSGEDRPVIEKPDESMFDLAESDLSKCDLDKCDSDK